METPSQDFKAREAASMPANRLSSGRGWLLAFGAAIFHLCFAFAGHEDRLWLPGLGVGIALVAWLGWQALPLLAVDLLIVKVGLHELPWPQALLDTVLLTAQMGFSWWLYHRVAQGSRWLDDPRSATLFLIIVPGMAAAVAAIVQAACWQQLSEASRAQSFPLLAGTLWLSRALGILTVLPPLLVVATPTLVAWRWVPRDAPTVAWLRGTVEAWTTGEVLETLGLCFGAVLLAFVMVHNHKFKDAGAETNWTLWGLSLLVVVWTAMRQGLRGGALAAGLSAAMGLSTAQAWAVPPSIFSPLQGNFLALSSTALLVGASAMWIRANEARYRHVVGHIPVLLYSARLPRPLATIGGGTATAIKDNKTELSVGPALSKSAEVMLVSPASREIFGAEPDALLGPYARWLERIVAEDRELVVAALAQICLQRQPVTCEYRLAAPAPPPGDAQMLGELRDTSRWLRDTLAPFYSAEGLLEGWDGVLEDITEQRRLSQHVRRSTGMLQALVANLPTGVFFVQGPNGNPLLVNARARQLLGQREDTSGGLARLSEIYRFYRADNTEYPVEDLPVYRALRHGVSCMANDLVVHRPDGRRVPLVSWAAPVNLGNHGPTDAAVWVLEDLTALQQAEAARRETEIRLRAIIHTMDEGILVQDAQGAILDCNPAVCSLLGLDREAILGKPSLVHLAAWTDAQGEPCAPEQLPDVRALRTGAPVRDAVLGLQRDGARRWVRLHALVLPLGPSLGPTHAMARLVTTVADISSSHAITSELARTQARFDTLLHHLPFMVLHLDRDLHVTNANPFVQAAGLGTREDLQGVEITTCVAADDRKRFRAACDQALAGRAATAEVQVAGKASQPRTVFFTLAPLTAAEGPGILALGEDVTELRRLEVEAENCHRLELVMRLTSGTVHDFNNLLTIMHSFATLARMRLPDDHPAHGELRRMLDANEQAAILAGQLLTFSKQRTFAPKRIDVNEALRATVHMLEVVIAKNIKIEMHLCAEPCAVLAEDMMLKQVIMNLCLNARDAMPTGGTLTLETERVACSDADWVRVVISDTGTGVPPDVLPKLFAPFFTTKQKGTGLGLSIVQRIVQELNGRIEVQSELNVGTRFEILIPRVDTTDELHLLALHAEAY